MGKTAYYVQMSMGEWPMAAFHTYHSPHLRAVFLLCGVFGMNEPEYQKKIVILYNMASGTVDLFHDDDLTYPELMGLLGMAQMILFRDYVNETEE